MNRPLLLLDFDTTLFRTSDFWQDFAIAFARASGKPEDTYVSHYDDFTKGDGQLRQIDYDTMIAHANIAEDVIRDEVKTQMGRKSYLFDDAKQIIRAIPVLRLQYDVAILTFGQPHYQNLKIEHTAEIATIPVHITQQLKTDYIRENFLNRPWGVLVDDKPDQNLPDNWTEIHIDRQATHYEAPRQIAPNVYQITTLDDVTLLLGNIQQ